MNRIYMKKILFILKNLVNPVYGRLRAPNRLSSKRRVPAEVIRRVACAGSRCRAAPCSSFLFVRDLSSADLSLTSHPPIQINP